MPAMGTMAATTMVKEEWKCVSMERLEQSVMWAGTSWMPKSLAVNLVSMVGEISCLICSWSININLKIHFSVQDHKC